MEREIEGWIEQRQQATSHFVKCSNDVKVPVPNCPTYHDTVWAGRIESSFILDTKLISLISFTPRPLFPKEMFPVPNAYDAALVVDKVCRLWKKREIYASAATQIIISRLPSSYPVGVL
jgi:hypothetical protein